MKNKSGIKKIDPGVGECSQCGSRYVVSGKEPGKCGRCSPLWGLCAKCGVSPLDKFGLRDGSICDDCKEAMQQELKEKEKTRRRDDSIKSFELGLLFVERMEQEDFWQSTVKFENLNLPRSSWSFFDDPPFRLTINEADFFLVRRTPTGLIYFRDRNEPSKCSKYTPEAFEVNW